MPHQGVDSIVAGAQLVQALQTVVSRTLHPCESAVVSVTQFHAGEAWNIIPEEVVLRGTIRSFKPEVQENIERAVERLCSGIAAANGAQISIRFERRYPPTVNSVAEAKFCQDVAAEVFGSERVLTDILPSMGAEIRGMGRATQGVTLISLDDGEKLAGLEKIVETVGEIEAEVTADVVADVTGEPAADDAAGETAGEE